MNRLATFFAIVLVPLVFGCGSDSAQCDTGEAGCVCEAASDCDDGLQCVAEVCADEQPRGLTVSSDAARSCEVLVIADGAQVGVVEFAEGVTGTSVSEPPHTAVTFFRNADAPFPSEAATFAQVGGTLSLERARCFDAEGDAISGATVGFE